MAKARTKKSKQPYLHPDMAPPSIPEIDSAAEAYYEAKNERQRLTEAEKNAKVNLVERMVAAKLTRYQTPDDLVVDLLTKSNVSCKKKQETERNGDA